jgi:DNA replication initiation complex subunit (GINS family)
MRSKFRYAQWRYGIADTEKYFIDINDFGKKEENELDHRKSFYEKVDLVIKELKEDEEKKEIMDDTEKYGIKINNKKNNKKFYNIQKYLINKINIKKYNN